LHAAAGAPHPCLKEATSYLYFDDLPATTANPTGAALGEAEEEEREEQAAAATVAPAKVVAKTQKESVAEMGAAEVPESKKTSTSEEPAAAAAAPSFLSSVAESAKAHFAALSAAAAPHQTGIVSGLALVGVVALAVVVRRAARAAPRHVREDTLDDGHAQDQEFAPLLIKKRSSAAASSYGAM